MKNDKFTTIMSLELLKNKKIRFTIIGLVVFATLSIAFFTYQTFNPNIFILTENDNQKGIIQTQQRYVLSLNNFDFFRPNYTMIVRRSENPNEKFGELGVSNGYLSRKWLFFFQLEVDTFIGYKVQDMSEAEVVDVASRVNLRTTNPDPDKFLGSFGIEGANFQSTSKPSFQNNEEMYYEDKGDPREKPVYMNDIKSIQLGSTREVLEQSIGKANRAYSVGRTSNQFELIYQIADNNIHFAVFAFDKNALLEKDAVLTSIYTVSNERKVDKIK